MRPSTGREKLGDWDAGMRGIKHAGMQGTINEEMTHADSRYQG